MPGSASTAVNEDIFAPRLEATKMCATLDMGLTWDHRKQQIRLPPGLEVERVRAAEDFLRPVARIVVRERADAGERVAQARDHERRAGIFVVSAAHGEREPEACRDDDAGRPDFDVELRGFTRNQ